MKNHLRQDDSYFPRVIRRETLRFSEVLDDLSDNTALETYDLSLALEKFTDVLTKHLIKGRSIKTPFGVFEINTKGTLAGPSDVFKPGPTTGHGFKINFLPNKDLNRTVLQGVEYERVNVNPKAPLIDALYSLEDSEAISFHPGEVIKLEGINLRCDLSPEVLDEGVYFISGESTETKAEVYLSNTEKALSFKIPELASGDYELEVRSRYGNPRLRIGDWGKPIQVISSGE